MIAQPKNRVQAIKSKFESLNKDNTKDEPHLSKQGLYNTDVVNKENATCNIQYDEKDHDSESSNESWVVKPNMSYLHAKNEDKKSLSETKKLLSRQSSDPGKKLHRSHAFRCDRSKVVSPKRHGSCYGRPENSGFSLNMEKKLPKEKLRKLSSFIEVQMRKDSLALKTSNENIVGQVLEVKNTPLNSIPDSEVPKHILDQYAKVVKPKNNDVDKKECTTDSGVSSETEDLKNTLDDEKPIVKDLSNELENSDLSSEAEEMRNVFKEETSSVKRLTCQFESTENNLHAMNDLCASSETIKLERKNPNLVLTSTLKKALKQPLPPGPPPKKPPRTFVSVTETPEKEKKDAKKMLEKLEQVLQKRESNTLKSENSLSPSNKEPKEIHYLCTEILDITHRTLLPNSVNNCLKSLNCAVTNNSTLSLPYARLSNGPDRQSFHVCSCSSDNLAYGRTSTFLDSKCVRCQINSQKHDEFKCHLDCKCRTEMSKFYVEKEHIYDEPCVDDELKNGKKNHYGTLNHSKSLEDLRTSTLHEMWCKWLFTL
ncbi:suppression of tumorigenicity 5 protein-like [Phthorimaea operculella]|nr:suppression of tumorigenicity 5 protein-like [Phthorimaea operculella]